MLNLVFKKIDKSKYPKTARRWSLSALFIFPIFVIANKLWPFLYLYLILNLINLLLVAVKVNVLFIDIISFTSFVIIAFYTFFLIIYGRALAWQKLDYKNNDTDVAKFKLRQRIVLYANIFVIGLLIIYIYYSLNIARFASVS